MKELFLHGVKNLFFYPCSRALRLCTWHICNQFKLSKNPTSDFVTWKKIKNFQHSKLFYVLFFIFIFGNSWTLRYFCLFIIILIVLLHLTYISLKRFCLYNNVFLFLDFLQVKSCLYFSYPRNLHTISQSLEFWGSLLNYFL